MLIERVENYRRRFRDSPLLIKKDISSLAGKKWDSRPLAYLRWVVHNLKKKPSPRQVVNYLSRHIYSHNDNGSSREQSTI